MSQIITKADFVSYMQGKATSDSLAGTVTDAINEWIEHRTGRAWGGDPTTITEEHFGYKSTIWLRRQDVTAVSSVVFTYPGTADYTIDTSAYSWDSLGRIVFYPAGLYRNSRAPLRVKVTYSYGATVVPADLKLAALSIAGGLYNYAVAGNQQVVAASVGSYRLEYIGAVRGNSTGTSDPASNVSQANWATVDSYAMKRV